MQHDISGFGLRIHLIASNTFPAGFTITQFSDDTDPLDTPEQTIGEATMGANADMLITRTASIIQKTISVIPDSEDDRNLQTLFNQNRAVQGKASVKDVITMTCVWPDGKTETYTQGAILSGPAGTSFQSAGRKKTPVYGFAFENTTSAG